MLKSRTLLVCVCGLIVTGCLSETHISPAAVSASSSGTIGFDHSHIFFKTVDGQLELLVWKAFSSSDVWDHSGGPDGETMTLKDDRTLEWERIVDSDTIKVNGKQYSLKDGRLLLLALDGEDVKVQQLTYDLSMMGSTSEEISQKLSKMAEEDESVREFLDAIEPVK